MRAGSSNSLRFKKTASLTGSTCSPSQSGQESATQT